MIEVIYFSTVKPFSADEKRKKNRLIKPSSYSSESGLSDSQDDDANSHGRTETSLSLLVGVVLLE